MATIKVNDKNFEQSIEKGIVLVDFWAEWCGPCRMIAPILEEISNEIKEVTIAKLDVDKNLETSAKYGIRSIPTMIIFKDGKVVDGITGAVPKQVLVNKLKSFI